MSVDDDVPVGRSEKSVDQLDQRGLSAPVRAKQTNDLPPVKSKV